MATRAAPLDANPVIVSSGKFGLALTAGGLLVLASTIGFATASLYNDEQQIAELKAHLPDPTPIGPPTPESTDNSAQWQQSLNSANERANRLSDNLMKAERDLALANSKIAPHFDSTAVSNQELESLRIRLITAKQQLEGARNQLNVANSEISKLKKIPPPVVNECSATNQDLVGIKNAAEEQMHGLRTANSRLQQQLAECRNPPLIHKLPTHNGTTIYVPPPPNGK